MFGELVKQTDEEGNVVEMDYDLGGRITEKAWTGGQTITYNYSPTTGYLTSVESTNGTEHSYTYDSYFRLDTKTEEIDQNNIYTAEYSYNTNDDISSLEVNDDVTISYDYNSYGYMDQVDLTTTSGTTTIWEGNAINKYGIYSDYDLGNGASTTLSFDQYGYLDTIRTVKGTTDIQDWDYDFNTTFGNMTKRKGLKPNGEYIAETFAYDSQDRLLARYRGVTGTTLTYDTGGEGNITSKTDVGTYNYNSTYPHQVEEITNPTSLMQDLPTQDITYTRFNKTSTVSVTDTGLDKDLTIIYGPDQLRVKTVLEDNSSTVLTKYYALGMYEKEVHATEGARELYYINTPSGISAILESTSSYDSVFYIHTDILGSYDVITDDQGGIRERLSFDPWGRRRNTSSWDYTSVPASFKFDRGFTGHEHLDDFNLINMNGRMYDPILSMFLSPDPFIQLPHETQNYNRYAYVMNNALKYTDPTGYKRKKDPCNTDPPDWVKRLRIWWENFLIDLLNSRGSGNNTSGSYPSATTLSPSAIGYSIFGLGAEAMPYKSDSNGGGGMGSGLLTTENTKNPRLLWTQAGSDDPSTINEGTITFTYRIGATFQKETNFLGFGFKTIEYTPYARFISATLNELGNFTLETGGVSSFKYGVSIANISGNYYWNRISSKLDLRIHIGAVDIVPFGDAKLVFNPFSFGQSIKFYNSFETEVNVPLMNVLYYRQEFFEKTGIPLNR
ncbi:MAG: RHS repeat-associated core domain-containing protein [Bacteroidales bacterium]